MAQKLDPKLREILVCPACKGELTDEPDALVCPACRLRYPIRDGIPVMLADEAEPLDAAEPAKG